MNQETSRLFMVRPAHFGYNEQTALSNTFQNKETEIEALQEKVLAEFDAAVTTLREAGLDVWVIEDDALVIRPDAVFPNNWISTHEDGTLVLYPMLTPNRRSERRADVVQILKEQFYVNRLIDLSSYEAENKFLEGTGSIVFDHTARIAYACLSPRTDRALFEALCKKIDYTPLSFRSVDEANVEVYHTNVIMGIGKDYAVICLESISDQKERAAVIAALNLAGKEIIDISFEQVKCFCGNVLSFINQEQKPLLAMSLKAFNAFDKNQIETLERHTKIVPIAIPTIETIGGGSVRCMLAQNFLNKK